MKLAAIVPAGGYGRGSQRTQKKACQILEGRSVLAHALARLEQCARIDDIFVVVPPDDLAYFQTEIFAGWVPARFGGLIAGGMLRQDSIKKALDHIGDAYDYVLIHDGNRPFVSQDLLQRTVAAAEVHGAAICAVAERGTVKGISRQDFVALSYDRRRLRLAQTPQVYRYDILSRAYAAATRENFYGPDDSVLVERIEEKIKVVAGSRLNLQISAREDLQLARALLALEREDGRAEGRGDERGDGRAEGRTERRDQQ